MPLLTGLKQQRPSVTFAIELEPALGLRCLSGKYRAGLRNRVEPVLRFFLADLAHVPVLSGAARRPCLAWAPTLPKPLSRLCSARFKLLPSTGTTTNA